MKAWIRRSFHNRIFVTVLLMALLPLIFCNLLMMHILIRRSESSVATQAEFQLSQMTEALDTLCQSYEHMTETLCNSTAVRNVLRDGNRDSRVLYQLLFRESDSLREYARFDLFDRQGNCLYTTDKALPVRTLDTDWGILYAASQSDQLVYRCDHDERNLMAARTVRRYNGEILGYLVISMEEEHFDLLFDGLYTSTNDVLLLDSLWHTIYHTQPSQSDTTTTALRAQLLSGRALSDDNGEYYFHTAIHPRTGFTLILQQPRSFTTPVMLTIYTVNASMSFLCLLLCLWCAWRLSRHLSEPVKQLDAAMAQVEQGNYDIHMTTDREDELGRLTTRFNHMTDEYRANLIRSVQRQKELNETQLRMMQAQLNPHFLYNTLDSMKWLGVTHQVPQVATLATDLATILRAGISGNEFITLDDELELIERYLDIQAIRFEDRFTCEIDIAEHFRGCLVPKLLLQPLVENAIIHGVVNLDDGYIKLWAEEQDGDLILSVSDNGCGIPEDMLLRLNSKDCRMPSGHLGLFNVSTIIRLHFGDKYGISAHSQAGQGSCVQLRLPICFTADDIHTRDSIRDDYTHDQPSL